MLMPVTDAAPVPKKSKMLLLLMTFSVLLFGLAEPSDVMPLVGILAPAGPMLLFETVLPVLAPPVDVLNRIVPLAAATAPVEEPSTEQFVTVLDEAPLIKRMVELAAPVSVLLIVSELDAALRPFMATLSAPFRSIRAPAMAA